MKNTTTSTVFILYQTDQWKTKSTKVCFGAFSTKEKAVIASKIEDLVSHSSSVIIDEMPINHFMEI